MKRTLVVVGYGIAGLLVAVSLTAGAFALAGADIAQPASPLGGLATPATVPLAPTPSPHEDANIGDHHSGHGSPSPSASIDDHGGGTGSGSGTDDGSGGSDDGSSSGSGSGSDGSGDGFGPDD
jgi:hypothetical protein